MSSPAQRPLETRNLILSALTPRELDAFGRQPEYVELKHGVVLYDAGDRIDHLYFPNTAILSVVSVTAEGHTVEAGVVGYDGFSGAEALLAPDAPSFNRHLAQVPGDGHRVSLPAATAVFEMGGEFQRKTLQFVTAMMSQVSQTALCNRVHAAEARLAKWLLTCHDRAVGDQMFLTQEFIAIMLGANRTSVSIAAGHLQKLGLIEYSRGHLRILDRPGLVGYSCECYLRIRAQYGSLLAGTELSAERL